MRLQTTASWYIETYWESWSLVRQAAVFEAVSDNESHTAAVNLGGGLLGKLRYIERNFAVSGITTIRMKRKGGYSNDSLIQLSATGAGVQQNNGRLAWEACPSLFKFSSKALQLTCECFSSPSALNNDEGLRNSPAIGCQRTCGSYPRLRSG